MVAYVVVVPTPYFALTGNDGTFTIKNVPPGTYTLKTWSEDGKLATQTITVTDATRSVELVAEEGVMREISSMNPQRSEDPRICWGTGALLLRYSPRRPSINHTSGDGAGRRKLDQSLPHGLGRNQHGSNLGPGALTPGRRKLCRLATETIGRLPASLVTFVVLNHFNLELFQGCQTNWPWAAAGNKLRHRPGPV